MQCELKDHLDANLTRLTTLVTDLPQRREDRSMEEIPLRVSILNGGKRVRLVAGDLEDDILPPEEQNRPIPHHIDHLQDQVPTSISVATTVALKLIVDGEKLGQRHRFCRAGTACSSGNTGTADFRTNHAS